jgi:hypothetical protein
MMLIISPACGQEKDIAKIEETLRMKIDSSWTISIDTANIKKDVFDNGVLIGWVRLTDGKGDKLNLALCKSLNDKLLLKEIENHQLSASCLLSEDSYLSRSELKMENHYLFLPMYPCWSAYSANSKHIWKELVEKTK